VWGVGGLNLSRISASTEDGTFRFHFEEPYEEGASSLSQMNYSHFKFHRSLHWVRTLDMAILGIWVLHV